ncbi:MAG: ABC transporter permease [Alphaproteobacteria bacterium]|nr:ABC transporter permease [Alphaproteobacteria bacterium]
MPTLTHAFTTTDAPRRGRWKNSAWYRLLRHRMAVIGFVFCLAALLMAGFADVLATHNPERTRIRDAFQAPSPAHVLGADHLGRDIWSRVVYGSRISIGIGVATVVLTGVIGAAFGLISGYFRRLDDPLMRVMDALMAFPGVMLAVAITAALGPSAVNVVIALTAVYVPRTARITRASVLVVREMDYVQAARALGAGHTRMILRHILPNSLGPLVVQLTFVFAYAVLSEAALSFLGMGPPPPTPTWGNIISDGRDYLREAPWICLYPGLAISVTVLGLNLLGDGLRDVLDPRMKVTQG